jgi:hypothetical protein
MTVTLQARAGHWHWPLALELKAGSARLLASAMLAALRLPVPMHYISDVTQVQTQTIHLLFDAIRLVAQLKLWAGRSIKPLTRNN